ncbi:L-serine ammonia-lyase, iron-sulfur-dependent subunit beta [Saccharibacillus sp. CPCC 101409]|uniref:L-serine ammonia-lyase, iron-sulfur-dependent subunit beta n=1 Tax=Saccharibacillus sp. CPCC 101409 TaxID=3058041 RepID=UPI0026730777|nr:L-serine ammonia-lyase, iron-sulfur-dependent subunit beta [Saccharibacillus sp. CPCC 101409]MDO3408613.1 L-serine ammonia-lyase, iron-sulfur-dependent subunit beta [Saccharibacillus sp. CPCC 101409]
MRFKNVFSIIGPSMVGPSSSHTAGAVRIGLIARQLLAEEPVRVKIALYGSFAETYWGHGTDLALAGGLLGYATDDARVADALEEAQRRGIEIAFVKGVGLAPHPNTAKLELTAEGGRTAQVLGASIGGGNVMIHEMNGFDVRCSGEYPTIVVLHDDRPGVLASLTGVLGNSRTNIGYMGVDRKGRSGEAMTVMELDSVPDIELLERLRKVDDVKEVTVINLNGGEEKQQ